MNSNASIGWPNAKRVAVLVSVLLETWADGTSPTYFPRTTPLKPGTPDLPGRQWSQYGGCKWHADALDTSLPRLQKTPSGSIVALPWSDFVDNRVLRASPHDYYDAYAATFDYLRSREQLGLLHIAIHGHFGGRPLMSAMFSKLLEHLSGQSDVWFASHGEIVDWFAALGVDRIFQDQRFTR